MYTVLAYYAFVPIKDPYEEVKTHKAFLQPLDATCRIYISEEGINGQLCCSREDAPKYIEWMHSRPLFSQIVFKQDSWHEPVYPRLTIKYRKHLVARDRAFSLEDRAVPLSPKEWAEMLEKKEARVLDVRNRYEWAVGHFEGAECPPCENFRDFEQYADQLKQECAQEGTLDQKVMMCCTGGIRCEVYSALLKQIGFKNVYQLEGGIINYGHQEGNRLWQGKLFVFDDRLTVPITTEEAPIIGHCHHCAAPCDSYYNCANTDCNKLFLCCPSCLHPYAGCCQNSCKESPRCRDYHQQEPHKPFRRLHLIKK